ncbi:LOW QUALITY PROTEIN: (R)-mandelonitrile lyase-like [Populus alba x Populus x berolinensis]|nr:LOW QUALITY PROTEIN: (R)-mandelonitrile lyase-like [Populus alba x Populus x berolinensis]
MKKSFCFFLIHIVFLVLFCSLFSHARPIPQTELRNWQSAVRDGLLEAGVEPYAANIQVAVHASVERILLASTSQHSRSQLSAIGVVYRDKKEGITMQWCVKKVKCHWSPQLLLISGIGPSGLPSSICGAILYDNPRNGISIVPPMPLENSLIQVVGITEVGAYLEAASTVIPFVSPSHAVFFRTPSISPLYLTVATLMEKIVGPLSTGSLRLASTDVRENPIVRFNYFSNPVDVERCVNGTRKIGDVLGVHGGLHVPGWFGARNFRYVGPALPVDLSDFTQMAEFCRRTVSTIWHYHGGCVVGKVVDRDYHLIGVGALRVVDGSTLTVSPGTNPQATLMMLGRYLGLKIIRERMKFN